MGFFFFFNEISNSTFIYRFNALRKSLVMLFLSKNNPFVERKLLSLSHKLSASQCTLDSIVIKWNWMQGLLHPCANKIKFSYMANFFTCIIFRLSPVWIILLRLGTKRKQIPNILHSLNSYLILCIYNHIIITSVYLLHVFDLYYHL